MDVSKTTIDSAEKSFRWGLLGQKTDEQAEGTNGAARVIEEAAPEIPWTPLTETIGCHPSGACPNYLRMKVEAASLAGDFDLSGALDAADIDLLTTMIRTNPSERTFDLNNDGTVDDADLTKWRTDAATHNGFGAPYLVGDSNLDGSVNAADLNNVALNWRQDDAPRWSAGDFKVDGSVNALDLNELALNWQQSIPMASTASAAVPEPSALVLAAFGLALIWRRPRRS
jgi:hypothetical protein